MSQRRMILVGRRRGLSITFTFKPSERRRDTDRPTRSNETRRRVYTDLSHLRQRQPRHLGQAAAANLSHCNCNSTTEVIRPVLPLFFSFSHVHSSRVGFFTFFRIPSRGSARKIPNFSAPISIFSTLERCCLCRTHLSPD